MFLKKESEQEYVARIEREIAHTAISTKEFLDMVPALKSQVEEAKAQANPVQWLAEQLKPVSAPMSHSWKETAEKFLAA